MNQSRYNPVKTELTDRGLTSHTIDGGDGKLKTLHYSAVRAGLTWATSETPAFYVILGEEHVGKTKYQGERPHRGKLKFFKEQEISSLFLDKLFSKLSDDCVLFGCKHVYADLRDSHETDAEFFHSFVYDNEVGSISMQEAPFLENFALRVSLIKRFMNDGRLVDIPKNSIVREQLKRLATSDLEDAECEKRFYAVSALSFSIAAFYKLSGCSISPTFHPTRRKTLFK